MALDPWSNVSTDPRSLPSAVTWLEVTKPSVPLMLMAKPLARLPPSVGATPFMVTELTPLASPTATSPWVGTTLIAWFIVGDSPNSPLLTVTVPCAAGSRT